MKKHYPKSVSGLVAFALIALHSSAFACAGSVLNQEKDFEYYTVNTLIIAVVVLIPAAVIFALSHLIISRKFITATFALIITFTIFGFATDFKHRSIVPFFIMIPIVYFTARLIAHIANKLKKPYIEGVYGVVFTIKQFLVLATISILESIIFLFLIVFSRDILYYWICRKTATYCYYFCF